MARTIEFKEGDLLIESGSREKVMYIMLSGEVVVELNAGDEKIEVARMGKGGFFGEISFFSDESRSADVRALEDGRCILIDSLQQLNHFLTQNPKFAAKMVQILAGRLARTDELLIGKISDKSRIEVESKGLDWNIPGVPNE